MSEPTAVKWTQVSPSRFETEDQVVVRPEDQVVAHPGLTEPLASVTSVHSAWEVTFVHFTERPVFADVNRAKGYAERKLAIAWAASQV